MLDDTDKESSEFFRDKHIEFIKNLNSTLAQESYEYWLLEHLRMNGLYWAVMALVTIDSLSTLPEDEVVSYILSCWDSRSGGFGAHPSHDSHILSTLSAIQVLAVYGRLDSIKDKRNAVIEFIKGLQLPNGSFQGDSFGEVDTRFVYTAVQSLALLEALTDDVVRPAVAFTMQCENFDGAFGMLPGAESHAAQVFTCLGTLAITDSLHLVDSTKLGTWLSERQVLPSGGLNGRPEKLPDVCYSWWVLSSLSILGKVHWIDAEKLKLFILSCQDSQNGGISDRKGNQTDIFHTCFGITGLSLLGVVTGLKDIDPIYCLPRSVSANIKLWPRDYGFT